MKIRSTSLPTETSIIQQDSNAAVTPKIAKEALPDGKNLQLSGQFATSVKSEQSMIATSRATELQSLIKPDKDKKLEQLGQQLESLKEQKSGLKAQIVATSAKVMGAELAGDQKGLAAASAQLAQLKSQLAKVDVEIKAILSEIEKLKQKEDQEKENIQSRQEQESRVNSNLQKAADAYSTIMQSTIIKP